MYQIETSYPWRMLCCLGVCLLVLALVLRSLWSSGSSPTTETIPSMSKPSVFYQLGQMLDLHDEHDRQLHRDMWLGTYEMDAILADPANSAWASGSYLTAGAGVAPDAVGKLSDQVLSLFRRDLEDRANGDFRYAPADIRR